MKNIIIIATISICFILNSCITEYTAKGVNEEENILVVEGLISEGESTITLSKSKRLTNVTPGEVEYVSYARVYVECDDGTFVQAEKTNPNLGGASIGQYQLHIDKLYFDRQYRLKILLRDDDYNALNQDYEYCSAYMYPNQTPEIDSVFFTKAGRREPILIHIANQSKDENAVYFRWSFTEDWEIHSTVHALDPYFYPYYCWGKTESRDLMIGSAQRTVGGRLTDRITEIASTNSKLKVLYRIRVTQYALNKRAYEYFTNIKKNIQQTGDLFAPIPSELRGNITCTTDPDRPVIGYVEISSATQKQLYIGRSDSVFEQSVSLMTCDIIEETALDTLIKGGYYAPGELVPYYLGMDDEGFPLLMYMRDRCIDCTHFGTTIKPDDWPDF